MISRPITFNGAMVRAMLDGSKTQTRRIVKDTGLYVIGARFQGAKLAACEINYMANTCPYGQPGNLLWVRETFQGPLFSGELEPPDSESPEYCKYAADGEGTPEFQDSDGNLRHGWKPSIHMPRWASRIMLEIVSVRISLAYVV